MAGGALFLTMTCILLAYFLRKFGGFNYFSYLGSVNLTQDMSEYIFINV